jgi:tyrosyl-tRNA synthetase
MSRGARFTSAFQNLQRRGNISESTPSIIASISAALDAPHISGTPPLSVYAGFDPTAPSLHLGHASVIIFLRRLARAGLRPIALVGGATALLGDPTGRSVARPTLSREEVRLNASRFAACLAPALGEGCLIVDNAETYTRMGVLDFFRDVGTHFRLSSLLQRETVKSRLGLNRSTTTTSTGGGGGGNAVVVDNNNNVEPVGMSFTELAYPLLQAHDFACLASTQNAILQIGGSDQWGNIASGVDHIRRIRVNQGVKNQQQQQHVHGATVPLLLDSVGRKFGKSEGNIPVWLDSSLTSHHKLWQHLFSIADNDAPHLLRALSPAEDAEQDAAIEELSKAPERKAAQRLLADGLVQLFRGDSGLKAAHNTAAILFGGTHAWAGAGGSGGGSSDGVVKASSTSFTLPQRALLPSLRADDILALSIEGGEVTNVTTSIMALNVSNGLYILLVNAGLAKSKSEAKRLVEGGGVYWNWERVSPKEGPWALGDGLALRNVRIDIDFIEKKAAVLSVGKKRMAVVQLLEVP